MLVACINRKGCYLPSPTWPFGRFLRKARLCIFMHPQNLDDSRHPQKSPKTTISAPPRATPKTPPRAHSKRRIFRCNFAIPRATPFFAHFCPRKCHFLPCFVPSPCHVMPCCMLLTSFMPCMMPQSYIIIMLWCHVIIITITLSSSYPWWTILLHEVW